MVYKKSFWPASNPMYIERHLFNSIHFSILTQRNGTLPEVYTIHTGHSGMDNFGYYDRINGADTLPFWPAAPCNSIKASEGSLFPPRDVTGLDTVFVYDKDVCRTLPFTYKRPVIQNGMWEAFKLKLRWMVVERASC